MDYRDILIFLHGGASNHAAVQLAGEWARAHGAAVSGVCLAADPAPSIADGFAMGRDGVLDVMERRQEAVETNAEPLIVGLRAAAAACGVEVRCEVPDPLAPVEDMALRARFADLTVIGRSGLADRTAKPLAEALAVGGCGPCVIVPVNAEPAPPRRIVVAWNGSAQATRAIADAMPLLKRAAAVQLLVFGEEPDWLVRCGAHEMAARLSRHGVSAELLVTPRPHGGEGEVLAAALSAFEADLLVMGAYSHSQAREAIVGGATRAVLGKFPIPVLLSR